MRLQNNTYLPYIFTEQGVPMLSGILNSKKAIVINIAIPFAIKDGVLEGRDADPARTVAVFVFQRIFIQNSFL